MKEKSVLFIDDEENILSTIERQLGFHGYKVFTANNAKAAFELLERENIPVIVSDQRMPDICGSDLLAQVKRKYPQTVRMIISGYTDFDSLQDAINNGEIFKFIPKPWEEEQLTNALETAFQCFEEGERKERKNKVLDNALEGVVITNLENIIDTVNLSFLLSTGYTQEELTDKNIWDVFTDFDLQEKKEIMEELSQHQIWQGETLLTNNNGTKMSGILSISEIIEDQKSSGYRAFSFMNVPELKQKEKQLENFSRQDMETKLLNRVGLEEQLNSLIYARMREKSSLYIISFYFDKFIPLSNILGQQFSLTLASNIAQNLKENLGNSDLCARLYHDIFVIVLRNHDNEEEVKNLLRKIRSGFENAFLIQQHSFYCKSFMGISRFPIEGDEATKLIDKSLIAAQVAHNLNRQESYYSENDENQLRMKLYLDSEIVNIVKRQGFELDFQAQYQRTKGEVAGFEAIVEVPKPVQRIITTELFLSTARNLDLIDAVERKVIRESLKLQQSWRDETQIPLHLVLPITLAHLLKGSLPRFLDMACGEFKTPFDSIVLQLEASEVLENVGDVKSHFNELHQLGIKIGLNNFSKYLSIPLLEQVTVDAVSINQSFLTGETLYDDILYALSAQLKAMGLKVLVKGIENEEQLAIAQQSDCDFLQGNILSPPRRANEVRRLLLGGKHARREIY